MFDIAIIGAGPAGATLARLVAKKYKVLLIDKRQLTQHASEGFAKTKTCGGLLAPDAQKMLALLGLGLPQSVILSPQLFAVRTIDLDNNLEKYYQRFYFNIDRQKFDCWLVSLIPDNVDIRFNCLFKSYEKKDDAFDIRFLQNGKQYTERARILIGAEGAFSTIRRIAFPDHPLPAKYIAVQEWFHCEKVLPYFTTIFDREITDFYSWTIPKENYLIIGSALPVRDKGLDKFELLKKKLFNYRYEMGHSVKKEGTFILRPLSTRQVCTGNHGIALLGEAAGWISPSSAEGLSYAFKSAMLCAQSMAEDLDNFTEIYRRKTWSMLINIIQKNLKSPFMYNSWLRKIVMSSGIMSIDVDNNINRHI